MQRKIRVLVGKPGLDGHDRGAKVVAAALRDAGMEVIYTGLHQSPDQIVEAALQEDVDVVALSILSGAHMTLFPEVLEGMRKRGLADRLLTGGGIIPPDDMEALAQMGVGRLFGPGTSTQDIAIYIRDWFDSEHRTQDVAEKVPAPKPVAKAAMKAPQAGPRTARRAKAGGRAGVRARSKAAPRSRPKGKTARTKARRAPARKKTAKRR
jgi:methylmalonyl-CoA mutase C-terminal domain/subunit